MTIPTHEIDRNSLTWRAVAGWAAGRIEDDTRALKDGSGVVKDDILRGRIKALEDLLALVDSDPAPTIESPSDYHA